MLGLASRAAVGKHPPIRERDLFQQPTRLAGFQRCDDHRDLVARLDHVELPTDPVEDAGTRALHGVAPGLALVVARGELDIDVRVVPIEPRHRPRHLHLVVAVIHGERMMRGPNTGPQHAHRRA